MHSARSVATLALLAFFLGLYFFVGRHEIARTQESKLDRLTEAGIAYGRAIQAFRNDHNGRAPVLGSRDWPTPSTGTTLPARGPLNPRGVPYFEQLRLTMTSLEVVGDTALGRRGRIHFVRTSATSFQLSVSSYEGPDNPLRVVPKDKEGAAEHAAKELHRWRRCTIVVPVRSAVTATNCETIVDTLNGAAKQ